MISEGKRGPCCWGVSVVFVATLCRRMCWIVWTFGCFLFSVTGEEWLFYVRIKQQDNTDCVILFFMFLKACRCSWPLNRKAVCRFRTLDSSRVWNTLKNTLHTKRNVCSQSVPPKNENLKLIYSWNEANWSSKSWKILESSFCALETSETAFVITLIVFIKWPGCLWFRSVLIQRSDFSPFLHFLFPEDRTDTVNREPLMVTDHFDEGKMDVRLERQVQEKQKQKKKDQRSAYKYLK